jgi:hypothetical protein
MTWTIGWRLIAAPLAVLKLTPRVKNVITSAPTGCARTPARVLESASIGSTL